MVIDGDGVAIYVADITYRSEVVRLHIDLLARSAGSLSSAAADMAIAAAPT